MRKTTIYAGSNEIQRNIIAKMTLGCRTYELRLQRRAAAARRFGPALPAEGLRVRGAQEDRRLGRGLQRRRSGRRSPRWASPALPLSPDYGGFGGGAVDLMGVMEAFGEALVVEPLVPTLARRAARRQGRQRRAEAGDPAGGRRRQDEARLRAHRAGRALQPVGRSRPKASGGKLDGEKSAVLGAPMADKLVVSRAGRRGCSSSIAPMRKIKSLRTLDEMARRRRVLHVSSKARSR